MNNYKDCLERRLYLNTLYDLYSPLLTERQRNVYEMLNFSDLTLSEAAQSLGVSRQAVHTLEKRISAKLETIESELGFAVTVSKLESRIEELEKALQGCAAPAE